MTMGLNSWDFIQEYRKLPKPSELDLEQWDKQIEEAADLSVMCGLYPGDVGGGLQKEICRLLNQEYLEPEIIITYG